MSGCGAVAHELRGWYPTRMGAAQTRVVADSLIGIDMPDVARWSDRVTVVLGLNPGPFTGPGTNTYVVGTGPERVLIDAGQGVPDYLSLLERGLRETARARGLERIVVTHAHPDHIGGVAAVLGQLGDVPVHKMPFAELDQGLAVRAMGEGDEVRTSGATLRALWTPGHARDHLCFYLEEERALFTGDLVLGAGTTVIPRDGDLGDYLASLRRLLDLDVAVIYPAHGPAVRDPIGRIRDYIAHRELRDRQILAQLERGPRSVREIVAALYTDVPAFLHGAAAMSVEAHLRKLASEGRIERLGGDGADSPEQRWRPRLG